MYIIAGVLVFVIAGGYFASRSKAASTFYTHYRNKILVYSNHATMLVITWQSIANLVAVHKFKVTNVKTDRTTTTRDRLPLA